jgi:hypothetical protein
MAELLQEDGRLNSCILIIWCGPWLRARMGILRFEGHRLFEPVERLNRTAAGCYYSGPEDSRLYAASRKIPVQRTTSSSSHRNGIPNSPFSDQETLSLFPCSSNRESGARALSGDTQAMFRAPRFMKNVKLISGALLALVAWPFGNRKNIHIQGTARRTPGRK